MDGKREKAKASGRAAMANSYGAVQSPIGKHLMASSNMVISTAVGKHSTSHTDDNMLKRAIADYNIKVPKASKSKGKAGSGNHTSKLTAAANAATAKAYGGHVQADPTHKTQNASKRLADTYMVGGCAMDL